MEKFTTDELKQLELKHFPEPVQFPLWGFHSPNKPEICVFTRGRTCEEAWEYIQHSSYKWLNVPCDSLHCGVAKLYDQNHEPGWLTRPPVWLVLKLEGIQHPIEITIAHQYPC